MEQALRRWFKIVEEQLDALNQKLAAIQQALQSGVAILAPTEEPKHSAGAEQLRQHDEQMAKNVW
jgi:Skp family chaperone for outer membrane proteins